ncbi:MAG: iron-containing alcohol dehydrogenase [Rhizobiales bacterium]|nr:iron-containing alcohol dehydrogenase [Hyphomicrobiales bacterium]
MTAPFVHDAPAQRVVYGAGSADRIADEVARLGLGRVLVVATPGSGARLGTRVHEQLADRSAGLHAHAVMHVPRSVAREGLAAAHAAKADGLVAVGGGSSIGLAKAIALETGLPIIALPTTYAGSEATPIYGLTEDERKITGRDWKVLPRTVVYDPDLTLGLPAAVSAASGMNGIAHCVEALWVAERTPISVAYAAEGLRRFAAALPRVVADGQDRDARGACLVASWLAGAALTAGTALHHKLAHVLGGLGLPHAETHAIILPHVSRFNLDAAPEARARMAEAIGVADPAEALARMLRAFPIPQRLRDIGFDGRRIDFVADEIAHMNVALPRKAGADETRRLLREAF